MTVGFGGSASIGFDLDGVLMRNPFAGHVFPAIHRAMRAAPALQGLSVEVAKVEVTRAVNRHMGDLMRQGRLVAAYDWDSTFRAVAATFGGAGLPDVTELVREGCAIPGVIAALPHATETLAYLERESHRLVIVSNGYSYYQEPVLEALGLLHFFEAVITPDRAGAAKPEVAAFEAAGRLDWFVGDTLIHDVYGARAAHVKAIWLDAKMPAALKALPVSARTARPELAARVVEDLSRSPYREFHPDAGPVSCAPDAVIGDLWELREALAG